MFYRSVISVALRTRQFSSTSSGVPILHVTARHGSKSLVAAASNQLFEQLAFKYDLKEKNLWSTELPPYDLTHMAAKFRLVTGKGSEEDKRIIEPISAIAQELNKYPILVVSTPIWNLSVPYVLKQYLDIAIQPGINCQESEKWPSKMTPVVQDKTLVTIYSCGAHVGDEAMPQDFLGPFVEKALGMVGYTNVYSIRIEGALLPPGSNRKHLETEAREKAIQIANQLSSRF